MIDWNQNGKIDPVDVGISIAISQGEEPEVETVKQEEPSLFELLKRKIADKKR